MSLTLRQYKENDYFFVEFRDLDILKRDDLFSHLQHDEIKGALPELMGYSKDWVEVRFKSDSLNTISDALDFIAEKFHVKIDKDNL